MSNVNFIAIATHSQEVVTQQITKNTPIPKIYTLYIQHTYPFEHSRISQKQWENLNEMKKNKTNSRMKYFINVYSECLRMIFNSRWFEKWIEFVATTLSYFSFECYSALIWSTNIFNKKKNNVKRDNMFVSDQIIG